MLAACPNSCPPPSRLPRHRVSRLDRDRIAWRGLAVERQAQNLADFRVRILRGRHALAIADGEEQVLAVGRKRDLRAELAAAALRHVTPQHLQSIQARGAGAEGE